MPNPSIATYEYEVDGNTQTSTKLFNNDWLLKNIKIELPDSGLFFIRKITDRASTSLANLSLVGLWRNKCGQLRINGTKLNGDEIVATVNKDIQLDELLKVEQELSVKLDSGYKNIALGEIKRFLAFINGSIIEPLSRKVSTQTSASIENGNQLDDLDQTLKSSEKRKEGILHAQGKAHYTADVKYSPNDVHLAFVLAKEIGVVKNIEAQINEDEMILTKTDLDKFGILNLRKAGQGTKDGNGVDIDAIVGGMAGSEEEPLIFEKPSYIGAPVGLILASSRERALEISANAKINMVSVDTGIFDIDEAIVSKSFHDVRKVFTSTIFE